MTGRLADAPFAADHPGTSGSAAGDRTSRRRALRSGKHARRAAPGQGAWLPLGRVRCAPDRGPRTHLAARRTARAHDRRPRRGDAAAACRPSVGAMPAAGSLPNSPANGSRPWRKPWRCSPSSSSAPISSSKPAAAAPIAARIVAGALARALAAALAGAGAFELLARGAGRGAAGGAAIRARHVVSPGPEGLAPARRDFRLCLDSCRSSAPRSDNRGPNSRIGILCARLHRQRAGAGARTFELGGHFGDFGCSPYHSCGPGRRPRQTAEAGPEGDVATRDHRVKPLNPLIISGREVLPLVEGGKGISVSNGESSGAWAAAGGVGTFSGVNADSYTDCGSADPADLFRPDPARAARRARRLCDRRRHPAGARRPRARRRAGPHPHERAVGDGGGRARSARRARGRQGADPRRHLRRRHALQDCRDLRPLRRLLLSDRLVGARVPRLVEARLPQVPRLARRRRL